MALGCATPDRGINLNWQSWAAVGAIRRAPRAPVRQMTTGYRDQTLDRPPMLVVASQRLDSVRPEDGEHTETTAEPGNRSDQSNLGDGGLIAGVVNARLRLSTAYEHYYSVPLSNGVTSIGLVSTRLQSPGCGGKVSIPRGPGLAGRDHQALMWYTAAALQLLTPGKRNAIGRMRAANCLTRCTNQDNQ
jgi:hypothetical protein